MGTLKDSEILRKNWVDQILNEKTAGIAIATASILLTKRSNVDTYTEINSYLGKLRGQQKLLDSIDIIEII